MANMPAAYTTIDLGLAYGKLTPLYYRAGDEHATAAGAPPVESLTALQCRVYSARLVELEALINDAPDNSGDFDKWVVEYADLRRALEDLATV